MMDYVEVFRAKTGRLRVEVADIQELNRRCRIGGRNGTGVQVVHGQRSERLPGIQRELLQLTDLGRKGRFDPANERTSALTDASPQAETSCVALWTCGRSVGAVRYNAQPVFFVSASKVTSK
jgi:hypothetical protein